MRPPSLRGSGSAGSPGGEDDGPFAASRIAGCTLGSTLKSAVACGQLLGRLLCRSDPEVPRTIYLARHGETDWNAAGRWQGQSDVPLNARGRQQALGLGAALRALRDGRVTAIVSSDLSRAQETATIAGGVLGHADAYVDAGLRERTCGVLEGLTRADCELLHP